MRRILLLAVASVMFLHGASAAEPSVVLRVLEGVAPATVMSLFTCPLCL